jgi:hypothetical protein
VRFEVLTAVRIVFLMNMMAMILGGGEVLAPRRLVARGRHFEETISIFSPESEDRMLL